MTARNDADRADTRLRGWRLGLAWLAWVVVFLLTLALLVYLVPANYWLTRVEWAVEVARPAAEVFTSYTTFVRILVALETLAAAVALGMGLLVVALRPADRMGLLASGFLLTMSPFMLSGNVDVWRFPAWLDLPAVLLPVYAALFMVGLVLFIFLFPDGRLAFPWERWLAVPVVAVFVLYLLRAPLGISDLWISEAWGILAAALLTSWLGGLAAQAYRYRRLASAEARQQIKWVLLGLSAPVTAVVVVARRPVPDRRPSLVAVFRLPAADHRLCPDPDHDRHLDAALPSVGCGHRDPAHPDLRCADRHAPGRLPDRRPGSAVPVSRAYAPGVVPGDRDLHAGDRRPVRAVAPPHPKRHRPALLPPQVRRAEDTRSVCFDRPRRDRPGAADRRAGAGGAGDVAAGERTPVAQGGKYVDREDGSRGK